MLERRRTLILEVRDGLASPESIALEEGRELDPTSVGSAGAWHVEGEEVLGVHAFVCFDGRQLFVQSADTTRPALVDGRPAPGEWLEVSAPAMITMGRVAIVFRSLSDEFDDKTEADPPRADRPAPGHAPAKARLERPFAPGAFASRASTVDSEATRLQGVPRAPAAPPKAQPRPAAGRPSLPIPAPNDEATRIEPSPVARTPARSAPPPARGPNAPVSHEPAVIVAAPATPPAPKPIDLPPSPPAAAPPREASGLAWALAQWRAASGPKKALVCLLPFALVAVFVIFRDDPPPVAPTKRKPAPSASVVPSANATVAPTPTSNATPIAPATAIATSDGGLTLERTAVDAVANGAYGDAIRAYDQLAAAYPDRPAYAEAARILRAKVDAGR